MGILMVDFIKAFDSVEHQFIANALKIFNFGTDMVSKVITLLTDRRACIDLGQSFGK
jgi:hypothetical protein